mmetsp:Transcript_146882/g.366322  ORF Transcript_146882/g.366322 Transcript_146882/m.366322 type:complete len:227 (-) Transcript_146882:69-749(-)
MAPVQGELAEALTRTWDIKMVNAPMAAPGTCCFAFWCGPCMAYSQRNELLDITGEPYICCAGLCPCGPCSKPCSDRNPWLCLEVCCCTSQAILGNRFMIQTRFDRQNDPCDDCLLTLVCLFDCLALFARCFMDEETADCLKAASDCLYATVCACMLTQHKVELEIIKEELKSVPYGGIPEHIFGVLPPKQQEMLPVVQGVPVAQGHAVAQGQPQGAPVFYGQPVDK